MANSLANQQHSSLGLRLMARPILDRLLHCQQLLLSPQQSQDSIIDLNEAKLIGTIGHTDFPNFLDYNIDPFHILNQHFKVDNSFPPKSQNNL